METDQQPRQYPSSYVCLITDHARQRWVERITNPDRFSHLAGCKKHYCEDCTSKMFEMRGIIPSYRRNIDIDISSPVRAAKHANNVVTDVSFCEAVRKRYGPDKKFLFLQDERAVYPLLLPDDEPLPVLVTVMTHDMIDGTVFRNFDPQEMGKVFNRWKHERRMTM